MLANVQARAAAAAADLEALAGSGDLAGAAPTWERVRRGVERLQPALLALVREQQSPLSTP